jgi:hypothetical protein
MPNMKEVQQLATELHDKKILNLDTPGRDLLSMQSSLLHANPAELAGWYVVGGDHYVVVCGKEPGSAINPAQIGELAGRNR